MTMITSAELYERLKALQDKAAEKSKATAQAADSDKRAAWSRVQQNTELADFLRDCKAEFGKPESVRIEIEGEEVWKS